MAFSDRDGHESKVFGDISKEIVKKCKGLPLAAKTLGSLMQNKTKMGEWKEVLNSKIWDLEKVEQESEEKGTTGDAVFDNLVARSFFQDFEKNRNTGTITSCKMHDIVHDFVQFLTKNECLIMDHTECTTSESKLLGDKSGVVAQRDREINKFTNTRCVSCDGNNDEAFQIGDLRKLNLEGSLEIQLVGDATDKSEVEKAQLWDKKLFHLTILYHNGTTWPNWIQSLKNLRFLTLGGGTQCELWPLGKLEYLETLTLWSMDGVRKVGVEFLGLEDQTSFRIRSPPLILFPKLKRLCFDIMLNWEEWEGVEEWTKEDSEITIMPCLSELTIELCTSLKALPDFLFKTPLQTLRIGGSERLLERYQEGNGEWAKIIVTNPNIRIIR
ncbi:unnamed protein product [Prunus armeniaca]|uniref:Uncharacterized protein n=1 Tax=Prunus armeniaca TaxID=36596 RepID=A0A6J5TU45_PRUAR|nr:unnamed protein product [Prunus armeniaca]